MRVRHKVAWIDPEIIHQWIVQGVPMPAHALVCEAGVPADATFVRGYFDPQRNVYGAVFAHPDWDEVEDGEALPAIEVRVQVNYGD